MGGHSTHAAFLASTDMNAMTNSLPMQHLELKKQLVAAAHQSATFAYTTLCSAGAVHKKSTPFKNPLSDVFFPLL